MLRRIKFNKTLTKLYLDIALMIAYAVSMKPMFTGESWHEWLGLVLGGAAVIHLLLNWKWVVAVTRRFFTKAGRQARINYVLDLLLFVSFTLTVMSGVIISKNLNTVQAVGLSAQAMRNWREIHVWIPNVTLLIVGIHLAFHWKWIVHTSKRYLFNVRGRLPRRELVPSENKS
jgi:hypothetical protein